MNSISSIHIPVGPLDHQLLPGSPETFSKLHHPSQAPAPPLLCHSHQMASLPISLRKQKSPKPQCLLLPAPSAVLLDTANNDGEDKGGG